MAMVSTRSTLTWRGVALRCPPSVFIAFLWIAILGVIALLANHLTPFDITATDLRARFRPPFSWTGGTGTIPLEPTNSAATRFRVCSSRSGRA